MKAQVMQALREASDNLSAAWSMGVKSNPMALELEVFKKMKEMQKELGQMMVVVSKLRGLGDEG